MGGGSTSRMASWSRPIVDLGLRHAPDRTDIGTSLTGEKPPSTGSPEGIDDPSVQFDAGCQSIQYLQLTSRIRARSSYHLVEPIISSGAGFLIAPVHDRSEPRDAHENGRSLRKRPRDPLTWVTDITPYPTSAQRPVRRVPRLWRWISEMGPEPCLDLDTASRTRRSETTRISASERVKSFGSCRSSRQNEHNVCRGGCIRGGRSS